MKKYKLCIFDLDGTLLNTIKGIHDTLNQTLKKYQIAPQTLEEVEQKVGNGIKNLIIKCISDSDNLEEIYQTFLDIYRIEHSKQTEFYPGIKEMIQKLLSEEKELVILSNKKQDFVTEIQEIFFNDLIELAYGEDPLNGFHLKPNPNGILKIIESLNYSANEVIYIGDSEVDFEAAKNAQVDFIGVTWGYRSLDFLMNYGVNPLVHTTDDLFNYLTKDLSN